MIEVINFILGIVLLLYIHFFVYEYLVSEKKQGIQSRTKVLVLVREQDSKNKHMDEII